MSRLAYRSYSERLDRQADALAVLPGGAPSSKPAGRCQFVQDLGDGILMRCLTKVALSVEGRPLCREHAAAALDFSAVEAIS